MGRKSRKYVEKSKATKVVRRPSKYKFAPDTLPKYREHKPIFGFGLYLSNCQGWTFECLKNRKEFLWVFKEFKAIAGMTWQEIVDAPGLYAHDVDWKLRTLPSKVKQLPEKLKSLPLFQFKVFQECRLFGLFDQNNVFQVLFVDRNHRVYPQNH